MREPPELCGVDEPKYKNEEERQNFSFSFRKVWLDALEKSIQTAGIDTLYLNIYPNSKRLEKYNIPNLVIKDIQQNIVIF